MTNQEKLFDIDSLTEEIETKVRTILTVSEDQLCCLNSNKPTNLVVFIDDIINRQYIQEKYIQEIVDGLEELAKLHNKLSSEK